MADAARETVEPELVCLVPTGVAIPPQARVVLEAEHHEPGLAVLGFGLDMAMYCGLLGGLAQLQRVRGDLHVFLELRGRYQHEIWRLAQDLELLHTISTFAKATQARSLLTDCDILVVPERVGIMRTVILETMAVGVPVIAGPDPWLDMFIDGKTAKVVADGEPASWAAALEAVVADPSAARAMGRAGRERIAARHRSTDQIRALSDAYEQMSRGEAIPL
jgi:glycosyltransferase involved in cell wall biosynthesis